MALRFLFGTLSILLTQLGLAAALAGIGLALRRGFGLRDVRLDDGLLAFWVGLALVTLSLLVWNFFLPITGLTLLLVLVAGMAGLFLVRRELRLVWQREGWSPPLGVWVILGIAGLWLATLALGPLEDYDSALYHLQAVRWAERYPAVPGVGNLYGPLAFNNSNLLFDALLSAGPWEGRSNHLAHGLLVLVFVAQGILAGARLAAGQQEPARWFSFLLLAAGTSIALNGNLTSFVTDLAPTLVLLVVAAELYARWSAEPVTPEAGAYGLVVVALLLAAAVSFKSNAAPFAVVAFPLAGLLWRTREQPAAALFRKTLVGSLAAIVLFASAWMGRGIVLSGYPLFPSSVAGVPVDWRVPAEHADAEFAYIVHSGQASTQNLAVVAGEAGFSSWFPGWLRRSLDNPYDLAIPLGLTLLGALGGLAARRGAPRAERHAAATGWWLLLPVGVALVAWFAIAPEPRYARPYFWTLAAVCGGQASRLRRLRVAGGRSRGLLLAAALLAVSPLVVIPGASRESPSRREGALRAILRANLNRPGDDLWFQPIQNRPELSGYRTASGLWLNIVPERCWDAPLPCTPNPAPNLRLRDSSNLARGFRVDGKWQMQNWPMSWQPGFLPAWRRSRAGTGGRRSRRHPTPAPRGH